MVAEVDGIDENEGMFLDFRDGGNTQCSGIAKVFSIAAFSAVVPSVAATACDEIGLNNSCCNLTISIAL